MRAAAAGGGACTGATSAAAGATAVAAFTWLDLEHTQVRKFVEVLLEQSFSLLMNNMQSITHMRRLTIHK